MMIRPRPLHNLRGLVLPLGLGLALLAGLPVWSGQNALPDKPSAALSPPAAAKNEAITLTPKQDTEPAKSKLEATKTDAAELSALADQLRDELNKLNVNVFSLDVLHKTEKVEKLAKKIKEEASESETSHPK